MRQIKFRGYNAKNKQWLYGFYLQNRGAHFVCPDEFATGKSWDDYEVDPESVGQFTGLKDRNGNNIYEGDIIRVKEFDNLLMEEFCEDGNRFDLFTLDEIKGKKRKEYTSPVFWDEGGFCIGSSPGDKDVPLCCLFGDMRGSSPIFEFDVIGNIYNKEDKQ